MRVDNHATLLRLLASRYDDLISSRTQAACRLHAVLRELIAGGAPRRLSADQAAKVLRSVRPDGLVARERKVLAADLLADMRRLDRDLAAIKTRIATAVDSSGTTLVELHGVGPIMSVTRPASRPQASSRRTTAPRRSKRPAECLGLFSNPPDALAQLFELLGSGDSS